MNEIKSTIREFIVRKIMFKDDVSVLTFDELLLEKGIVDSMGIIQLSEFLQEEFAVSLTTSDMLMENFATIDSISNLIQSRKESA